MPARGTGTNWGSESSTVPPQAIPRCQPCHDDMKLSALTQSLQPNKPPNRLKSQLAGQHIVRCRAEDAAKETQLGQNKDAYVYLFHFPQLGSPTELLLCATPVPSASAGGPPLDRLWALELRPDEQLLTTGTGASRTQHRCPALGLTGLNGFSRGPLMHTASGVTRRSCPTGSGLRGVAEMTSKKAGCQLLVTDSRLR